MRTTRALALHALVWCSAGIVLLPLLWMLMTALRPASEILTWPPLFTWHLSLDHFRHLFQDTSFKTYVWNSLVVAVAVVALVDVVALTGAYSLSRSSSRSIAWAGGATLLGYMIAPIMIVVPFYLAMRVTGLANSRLSLVLAHTSFCLPFALWLMKSYVDDVPIELEKAARIDGASRLATLWSVVLPQVRAGIAAVSIFTFILSWNDYIFARILISEDAMKTIPVGIEDIATATVVDWGLLMAAGVTVTLPILAGFALVHRALVRGWGHSGLKG